MASSGGVIDAVVVEVFFSHLSSDYVTYGVSEWLLVETCEIKAFFKQPMSFQTYAR